MEDGVQNTRGALQVPGYVPLILRVAILRRLSVCVFSFPELHRHQPRRITPRVIATNLRGLISCLLAGFQPSVVTYSERDESTLVFPQPLSQSVFLGELGMDLYSRAHSTFSFGGAIPTRSLLQS